MTAELSVLIVNYNTWRDCAAAVQSLRRNPPTRPDGSVMPFEVIVVDNASPHRQAAEIEGLRAALAEVANDFGDPLCGQLILHNENGGYSKGVNLAFHRSRGRWILVSNPDLEFQPGLIGALQRHLETHPKVGCVVPKGYWDREYLGKLPPNTLPSVSDLLLTTLGDFVPAVRRRYSKRLAQRWLDVWEAKAPLALRMMSGCLFLIERSVFVSLGLMDERYPLYYEDADLSRCLRRANKLLVQVPDAKLVHFVNRSGQTDHGIVMTRHDISQALYFRKWYGAFGGWLLSFCQWAVRTPKLQRLRRPPSAEPCIDLGATNAPPYLLLPRTCKSFLLLVSLDSRFYLSGGLVSSGNSWTPSAAVFANFAPTTYWLRVFDLSDGRFEQVGTWRYTCVHQAAAAVALPVGG